MVVYTHPKGPSFFIKNKIGAPRGEMLGHMKPLSKISFNCSFSSFKSFGAILYGEMEIRQVFGRRSIAKSISLKVDFGNIIWKEFWELFHYWN